MKVTHICTTFNGGAGICARRIMAATTEIGVDTRALLAEGMPDERTEVVEPRLAWSRNSFVKRAQLLLARCGIGPKAFRISERIGRERSAMRTYCCFTSPVTGYTNLVGHPWVRDADIVHLHWIGAFVDYRTFFPDVGKPLVWTIHDENPALGGFHYSLWKENAPASFRHLDDECMRIKEAAYEKASNMTLVALSNQMDAYFASSPLLGRFPRRVIHNGVDGEKFRPVPKDVARGVLGIPIDNRVFILVAENINEERKGLKELVAALDAPDMPPTTLICLGNAKQEPKASFDIMCEGFVHSSRLRSLYYSAADYFALPSFQEAFAQTPLEAMACGCAVVAFPCSGMDSLINEGNGIVCRDFTVEALRDGIRNIMSRPYDRDAIRQDLLERFSYEVIARQYLELYTDVLRSKAN